MVQWLATLFYANNNLLDLPRPDRIQAALYVFMGLFDREVLHTNIKNCWYGVSALLTFRWKLGDGVYTRYYGMTVMVPSFWERQREISWCPEFEVELATGLLAAHCQAQHGK